MLELTIQWIHIVHTVWGIVATRSCNAYYNNCMVKRCVKRRIHYRYDYARG